jgi:hypothetical protein
MRKEIATLLVDGLHQREQLIKNLREQMDPPLPGEEIQIQQAVDAAIECGLLMKEGQYARDQLVALVRERRFPQLDGEGLEIKYAVDAAIAVRGGTG